MAWRRSLSERQQESVLRHLQSYWAWLRRRALPTPGLTPSEEFREDVLVHQSMNLICECHKAVVEANGEQVRKLMQEIDYYIVQLTYLRVGRRVR
jgi:hypothetical protein